MHVPNPERIQGASSEVARDINRRIVLNLIRTQQPISRADLARSSGLQRSTISLIVEQLIAERWVLEGAMGRLPRGRRPTYLRLNEDRLVIGVDIRPGQITVGLSDVNGKFTTLETMPTPRKPEAAIRAIIDWIRRIQKVSRAKMIEGVGISVPGRVEPESRRLVFAPNLNWPETDLHTPISTATGLKVELENAANACVLASVWFDRMASFRNLVVVTISEGIGTGLLINGQLAGGLRGMAGEFGHVQFDPNGPECGCGSRGCWEMFASNRAALRYYGENTDGLTFADLLSRADEGDKRAVKALQTMALHIARGFRLLMKALAPERIVVVGDVTRSWHHFGSTIQSELESNLLPGALAPRVIPADDDGMARLRGTVALVLQNDFGMSRETFAC